MYVILDAFDAIYFEAVNKENAEMRRIFLFRFDQLCACFDFHLLSKFITGTNNKLVVVTYYNVWKVCLFVISLWHFLCCTVSSRTLTVAFESLGFTCIHPHLVPHFPSLTASGGC